MAKRTVKRLVAGLNKPKDYPITQRHREEIDLCKHFIKLYFTHADKFDYALTSYGLKHQVENWARVCDHQGVNFEFKNHCYVSNDAFITAMYEMGYWSKRTEEDSPNYYFQYKWKGPKFYNGYKWEIPESGYDWEKTLNVLAV
ncbi:MAG: hypothetical protein ACYDEF_03655 [Methanosarcina sp.]